MCAQQSFRSACTFAQSDQNFTGRILDSQGWYVSSCWQRRQGSDCAHAQVHLSLVGRTCQIVRFLTLRLELTRLLWSELLPKQIQQKHVSPRICAQRRPRSACASAQADQGLRCPLTESLKTIECINGEQMPRWYFAHVQDESEFVHFSYAQRHFFAWHGLHLKMLCISAGN